MRGWFAIALFVVGYDLWAGSSGQPTLSSTFRQLAQEHRISTLVLSAYMAGHLHGFIPDQRDPLALLGKTYSGRLGEIRTRAISA